MSAFPKIRSSIFTADMATGKVQTAGTSGNRSWQSKGEEIDDAFGQ
jgi:hypothetical protein